jgi:hypothetical protein
LFHNASTQFLKIEKTKIPENVLVIVSLQRTCKL